APAPATAPAPSRPPYRPSPDIAKMAALGAAGVFRSALSKLDRPAAGRPTVDRSRRSSVCQLPDIRGDLVQHLPGRGQISRVDILQDVIPQRLAEFVDLALASLFGKEDHLLAPVIHCRAAFDEAVDFKRVDLPLQCRWLDHHDAGKIVLRHAVVP